MTIHESAQELFGDLGLDRADVRTIAKSIAQQIIDDSEQSESPLCGLVYDIRTLYDEGVPRCEFRAGEEGTVHFRGDFHVENAEETVQRQRTLDPDTLQARLEKLSTPNAPGSPS